MSIDFTPISGFIRIYDEGKSYENRDDYAFIATLQFLSKTEVYLSGAKGDLNKTRLIMIITQLKSMGIEVLNYERRGVMINKIIKKF